MFRKINNLFLVGMKTNKVKHWATTLIIQRSPHNYVMNRRFSIYSEEEGENASVDLDQHTLLSTPKAFPMFLVVPSPTNDLVRGMTIDTYGEELVGHYGVRDIQKYWGNCLSRC